jgi:hypothetical protein
MQVLRKHGVRDPDELDAATDSEVDMEFAARRLNVVSRHRSAVRLRTQRAGWRR